MKETWYEEEEDVLNIQLEDETYWKSKELSNGIILDISEEGSITAIEIPNASKVFSGEIHKVLEKATTKV